MGSFTYDVLSFHRCVYLQVKLFIIPACVINVALCKQLKNQHGKSIAVFIIDNLDYTRSIAVIKTISLQLGWNILIGIIFCCRKTRYRPLPVYQTYSQNHSWYRKLPIMQCQVSNIELAYYYERHTLITTFETIMFAKNLQKTLNG